MVDLQLQAEKTVVLVLVQRGKGKANLLILDLETERQLDHVLLAINHLVDLHRACEDRLKMGNIFLQKLGWTPEVNHHLEKKAGHRVLLSCKANAQMVNAESGTLLIANSILQGLVQLVEDVFGSIEMQMARS